MPTSTSATFAVQLDWLYQSRRILISRDLVHTNRPTVSIVRTYRLDALGAWGTLNAVGRPRRPNEWSSGSTDRTFSFGGRTKRSAVPAIPS